MAKGFIFDNPNGEIGGMSNYFNSPYSEIDINKITTREQPRKFFDDKKIEELSRNIKEVGVLTPIVVTKTDNGKYSIIAGERRFRATRKAGLKKIPAIIKGKMDDKDAYLNAIYENVHREDLNGYEEALMYKHLKEKFGLTNKEIALKFNVGETSIINDLKILNLHKEVIDFLVEGSLSKSQAKELTALEDQKEQFKLARKIIEEGLTIRKIREIISLFKACENENKLDKTKEITAEEVISTYDDYCSKFKEVLDAEVKISSNAKKGNGKIEIKFKSEEQLAKILNIITH